MKELTLAGGCFWGVEAYFKLIDGVVNTRVGYANGKTDAPTYEDVCKKDTGHAEVVKVFFDPNVLTIDGLLEAYFKIIDPTVLNRQGPDVGVQYRTGIYYVDATDESLIKNFVQNQQVHYTEPIVTEILPLVNYTDGELYHQDYLEKNPNGYCHIPIKQLKEELDK